MSLLETFYGVATLAFVGNLVISFILVRRYRRRRQRRSAVPVMGQRKAVPSVPQFGVPNLVIYHVEDYVEPLRCSVNQFCKGQELKEGERFWAVPSPYDPNGPFVVICMDCSLVDRNLIHG